MNDSKVVLLRLLNDTTGKNGENETGSSARCERATRATFFSFALFVFEQRFSSLMTQRLECENIDLDDYDNFFGSFCDVYAHLCVSCCCCVRCLKVRKLFPHVVS